MQKVIAAMNMTLDGFCDHTAMIADEEIHDFYTDLLKRGGALLYGRITYLLMEDYWPGLVKNPSGDKSMDDFANAIDRIPKVVFSHTLKDLNWDSARIATQSLKEEITNLKKQGGNDILIGSPSLIVEATNLGLVDVLQISVHPVIEGKGLSLFKNINKKVNLTLIQSKTFGCGAVTFYYEPKTR